MEEKDLIWLKFEYAWRWFAYHAEQRLKAFYYFLIIVGFLGYGYFAEPYNNVKEILLCVAGMLVSFAFYKLEIRNDNLVTFGRQGLDELEEKLNGLNIGITINIRREDRGDKNRKYFLPISHKFWLRAIYFGTFLIFLLLLLCKPVISDILKCIVNCCSKV